MSTPVITDPHRNMEYRADLAEFEAAVLALTDALVAKLESEYGPRRGGVRPGVGDILVRLGDRLGGIRN